MSERFNFKGALGSLNPWRKEQNATTLSSSLSEMAATTLEQTIDIPMITIEQHPSEPVTTTNMSREALKARRMARIEGASGLVEHFHVKVMLRYLDVLLLLVPFGIILLSTSELGQLFTGKPFFWQDQTSWNMYGVSFIAEAVYCALTFIWQYALAYMQTLQEGDERKNMRKFVDGVRLTWWIFSLINAISQYKYLYTMWHPSKMDFSVHLLICARVVILIGSEYACAKYLGWRVTTLHKISQEEKAKGEAYLSMEAEESRRAQLEAEADSHSRQIASQITTMERNDRIATENAERNAKVATEVSEIVSKSAVMFLNRFTGVLDTAMTGALEQVNENMKLIRPPIEGQVQHLEEPQEPQDNNGEM